MSWNLIIKKDPNVGKIASIPSAGDKPQDTPKWVLVEGYKAVGPNMTAFSGKEQYHLGETAIFDGQIEPCKSGYHFGCSLEEVIKHYAPCLGTRYFKVQGLVPAAQTTTDGKVMHLSPKNCAQLMYEAARLEYKTCPSSFDFPLLSEFCDHRWKYVAKEITFVEEVPLSEISKIESPYNELITTAEEYYTILDDKDLSRLARKKWLANAKDTFSESFNIYIFEKIIRPSWIVHDYTRLITALQAVKDEQISQDTRVMLFLKILE